MIYDSEIRLTLPRGTVVKGKKSEYRVTEFLHMSSRSFTAICTGADGTEFRIKYHNGESCMTAELLGILEGLSPEGLLSPVDSGEYGGLPFAIFPIVDGMNLAETVVSTGFYSAVLVPQMVRMMSELHKQGILLRDICPEHILVTDNGRRAVYTGLSNAVLLAKHSTATKAQGFGQSTPYLAPELAGGYYSAASDYFSLGMTLLVTLRGREIFSGYTAETFFRAIREGKVPGVNTDYQRTLNYNYFSEEDKLLYLIRGLLLYSPADRWGIGELRCWLNNQELPLVRSEGRIEYQYNAPFRVGNRLCWNYRQLTETLASVPAAWNTVTAAELRKYTAAQNIRYCREILEGILKGGCSACGEIFRWIYGINPALDGFVWKGVRYDDAKSMIRQLSGNQAGREELATILKDRCLSYFLNMRGRITQVSEETRVEVDRFEQWEIASPGTGLSRCMMRYAGQSETRSFTVEGRSYTSIHMLAEAYRNNGKRLRELSEQVLKNDSFQAWLWKEGLENAGKSALSLCRTNPEQSFYMLMKIGETAAKEEQKKRMLRELYLKYGEYAPIYWLTQNVSRYGYANRLDTVLMDSVKNAALDWSRPLDNLIDSMKGLITEYQRFVFRTAPDGETAEKVKAGVTGLEHTYYPLSRGGYFNSTWKNGLMVCSDFLRSVGE